MDRPFSPSHIATTLLIALLLQACHAQQELRPRTLAYDRPADAPVAVAAAVEEPAPTAVAERRKSAEADYYNAAESQRYTDPQLLRRDLQRPVLPTAGASASTAWSAGVGSQEAMAGAWAPDGGSG
ncbi:MAG: hypothetical protein IPJ87_00115 [Flavobacteriales bacterium]|nr:hypothetical protein [Flavobacteriales bacterium]